MTARAATAPWPDVDALATTSTGAQARPPAEILLGLARALRAAGVPVTADRERGFVVAAAEVGLADARGVYLAGRFTLCASPADLARYDQVYAAWFSALRAGHKPRTALPRMVTQAGLGADASGGGAGEDTDTVAAQASSTEILRHRDVSELSRAEREQMARLFSRLKPRASRRRAHRHTGSSSGDVDARRTMRDMVRRVGEPGPLRYRRLATRPRRIVLLIDVSGSMSAYADALLRLAHRYVTSGLPVEVFTLGTRLTHVTRQLRHRDADRAIVAAGDAIPDWSGGTRLGEGLREFLGRWGRRGLARGAVVVILSDGWERDQPEALGEQVRRLSAVAHRVVWVNPHRGRAAYEPIQSGIVAVLPHVDDFVAGHSMAAFEALTEVVASA